MDKENNILAELPNLSPASRKFFSFKNNLNSTNRVTKRPSLATKKIVLEKPNIDLNKSKLRSNSVYQKILSKNDITNSIINNSSDSHQKDKALKNMMFTSISEIKNKKRYTMFEKPSKEGAYDTTEKALANFNAEKSSTAPLRLNNKQQSDNYDNIYNLKKEDLKNEFWIGESFKEKSESEYRPLQNWKKQQKLKNESGPEYKPLWQQKSNSFKGNLMSPLNSMDKKNSKITASSIYTGETYNDSNILFETTEKNKKLYDKIGGYKSSILEMKQEHNRLEMIKIPMITYEISKKEIVLNKLKDDMRFFNKDIERIKQNQELMEEENEVRLKNCKLKLDVQMSEFLVEQDKFMNENLQKQKNKQLEWKNECDENNTKLKELNDLKLSLINDNKILESQLTEKALKEKLELERLRQERLSEIEAEKTNFINTNVNFVNNSKLEKEKLKLLSLSDERQQENEKLSSTLQSVVQKITDENFLLSTVTDDEQMKSSELMKYGLEKMHPLERQLTELKTKLDDALSDEQRLSKDHVKLNKFIVTIQKKIDSLKE
ncbi:hypothetical protein ACO0SA_000810 [Hanseniaspora valbyensis]